MTRPQWLRRCEGFSIAEITTVLSVLTILSGTAAPAVSEYIEDAKQVRAKQDVRTIAVTLVRLFNDTATDRTVKGGWGSYDMLVGAGAVPAADAAHAGGWIVPLGSAVGLLDEHLVTNTAGYRRRDSHAGRGWRGAYLDGSVVADPWGNRYAVNVHSMRSTHDDTVVMSAGRDGIVASLFTTDGLPTGGDDVVSLVASNGNGTSNGGRE